MNSIHPLPFIFYPKLLRLCGLHHEQSAKAWTDEPGPDHAGHNQKYDANLSYVSVWLSAHRP